MKIRTSMLAGFAALSMVVAPVAAHAAAAPRAASTMTEDSEIAGQSTGLVIAALIAVIVGIVLIADGGDDSPTSP